MTTAAKIILKNLEEFNGSIKDEFVRKGINDTNNASDSLKAIQESERVFQSVGVDYIEVLDKGRSPGRYAPVDSIQDWVKSKLGITDEIEVRSIAYLVNRKIAREGTAIFKDNSKGLEIDEKIEPFNEKLTKDLTIHAVADVKKQLNFFSSQRI